MKKSKMADRGCTAVWVFCYWRGNLLRDALCLGRGDSRETAAGVRESGERVPRDGEGVGVQSV